MALGSNMLLDQVIWCLRNIGEQHCLGTCCSEIPPTRSRKPIENLGRTVTMLYTADLSFADSISALVPRILEDGYRLEILLSCADVQRRHPYHKFPSDDENEVYTLSSVTWWLATCLLSCVTAGPSNQPYERVHLVSRRWGARQAVRAEGEASLVWHHCRHSRMAWQYPRTRPPKRSKALSNEWIRIGIAVNGIAPGYIPSNRNEHGIDGRYGTRKEHPDANSCGKMLETRVLSKFPLCSLRGRPAGGVWVCGRVVAWSCVAQYKVGGRVGGVCGRWGKDET